MTGVANAHADANIFGADVLMEGPETVVTRVTAARFHAELAWCKIDLVVKNGDVMRLDFVKPHGLADGLT